MIPATRNLFIYFVFILLQWKFDVIFAGGLIDDPGTPLKYLQLDKDYRIYEKKMTWSEAQIFCGKCYESFATFENPEEITKVQELIYSISVFSEAYDTGKEKNEWGLERRYWFGLSDLKTEGSWLWTKTPDDPGLPLNETCRYFSRWANGQPDHFISKRPEHCVGFWNPNYHLDEIKISKGKRRELHTWNDFECDRKHYVICKKGSASEPAPNEECKADENKAVTAILPELAPPSKSSLKGCLTPEAGAAKVPPKPKPAATPAPSTGGGTPEAVNELAEAYSEEVMKKARDVILDWHNIFRNWHNASGDVPRLALSEELNKQAQERANEMLTHEVSPNTGENLYVGKADSGTQGRFDAVKSVQQAIKDWYYEVCDEEIPIGTFNHFSQLIWAETVEVGLGIATDKGFTTIKVVGKYDPVGNYPGEYENSVKPLRCEKSMICDGKTPKDNKDESACPPGAAPPPPAATERKRREALSELRKWKIANIADYEEPANHLRLRRK